jgi:hypothetical protein
MSYAAAAALQAAVYDRLRSDAGLAGLIGEAVFDAVPAGTPPDTYVVIGPEEVTDASDRTGRGAEHRIVVSVVSGAGGFARAKTAAAAVSDALEGAPLVLGRGRLVGLWFLRASARRRETGAVRRIDLVFRARIEL